MNALTNPDAAEIFRAKASDLLITAANMSLHQLVDEYLRLTQIMKENNEPTPEDDDNWGGEQLNLTGQVAHKERGIFAGAASARFGITFETYDY